MEYTLSLGRSKSRMSSISALKAVELGFQEGEQPFANKELFSYSTDAENALLLKRETSSQSFKANAELIVPTRKALPVIERLVTQTVNIDPPSAPSSPVRSAAAQLGAFADVIALLQKIFKGTPIGKSDLSLTARDRSIIDAIIRRKYGEALPSDCKGANLAERISAIIRKPSKKRPEEKYKFIFKRAHKLMKETFAERHRGDERLNAFGNSETAFYQFYFGEYAKARKLPLERYYNPKNSTSKDSKYHKTISAEYISLIRESDAFVANFAQTLNRIVEECDDLITAKLNGLGLRFVEFAMRFPETHTLEICRYLLQNAKSKLPWTRKEVIEAVEAVRSLFA